MNVSVVIPTYNRAHLISRAIQSALSECDEGDEIIVVDDGSTDNTEAVVAGIQGPIRYFKTSNSGAGAARNRGIDESRNPIVTFLDSDDEWLPGKLSIQKEIFNRYENVVYSFSNFRVRNAHGVVIHNYLKNWHKDDRPWDVILGPGISSSDAGIQPETWGEFTCHTGNMFRTLFFENYIITSSLAVRMNTRTRPIRFPLDLPIYEDWEYFAKLSKEGDGMYLEVETVIQHGHTGERLTDIQEIPATRSRIKTIERIWGKDDAFRERNEEDYLNALEKERLKLAKLLIKSGRGPEARRELEKTQNAPFLVKLASQVPGGLFTLLYRSVR